MMGAGYRRFRPDKEQCLRYKVIMALFLLDYSPIFGAERLVILSSQRKDMQTEFVRGFKGHYLQQFGHSVEVDWIDVGGAFEAAKFLKARFDAKKQTADVDILWGGGSEIFVDLDRRDYLQPLQLSEVLKKEVPAKIGGVTVISDRQTWIGAAMTSFGVFYNDRYFRQHQIAIPSHWEDLAEKSYHDLLSLPDPRRSSGFTSLLWSMTDALGWEAAWPYFLRLAANTRRFAQNSLEPIKAIETGDAFVTMTLDFFAYASLRGRLDSGRKFTLTKDKIVIDVDPVAVVKGAVNPLVAQRFVNYLVGTEGQKLFALAAGVTGGPKEATFGRISVNRQIYQDKTLNPVNPINPFTKSNFIPMASEESTVVKTVFSDLWGAMVVDQHAGIRRKFSLNSRRMIDDWHKIPFTRAELTAWAAQWQDSIFRQKKLNAIEVWMRDQLNQK